MLTVSNVELRFGARVLMSDVSFRVDKGDKIGLVGRNGAGKTTLTRMLSGDGDPAQGSITSTGKIGYLPQDPKSGDLETTARDRILGARGLDEALVAMRKAELDMGSPDRSRRFPAASAGASSWLASCSRTRTRFSSTSRPTTSMPIRSCGCAGSSRRSPAAS